jgi:nucleoside-diphosphate-sugar epimerase
MKIVITGAAGYIGSSLTKYLLKMGHSVTCFDNFMYGQESLVRHVFEHPKCKFYKQDVLCWSGQLCKAVDDADAVYPLSALVGAPLCDKHPELTFELNQQWQEDLVARLHNQICIYPNTNSAYGSVEGICTEETPINPLSLYAKTKQAAEDAHMTRKRSVCFRLATVFGPSPRQRTDLLINNLVGVASQKKPVEIFDGQFRRNYIHIDDLINALTFPLARQEMCGSTYNVGNDSLNMTKGDLIKEICRLVGGTWSEVDNRTDPDKRDYEVSSQKIYDVGFRCTRNLEYGVRQMQLVYANMKSEDAIKCKNY